MTGHDSINPQTLFTPESSDPLFHTPVIEIEEDRTEPSPHRYVHGRFDGTEARFSFYFPLDDQYQGRFFHNTYPMAISADVGPFPIEFEVATGDLGFTFDSGAYYVQTNNGGMFRVAGIDPAIAAWRVNAASARFSREVAARVYGRDHRPWGYLFGGSGGAYQTMGAAQATSGIWDGFVPFVLGCNHAIPSMFTVRQHAMRILRQNNRFPGIVDAIEPGGSGDPYAGLNDEEAAAFAEATAMGYPLKGWYGHETLDSGYFANISGMMPMMDPTYNDDFWSKPGYLGHDSGGAIAKERFSLDAEIISISKGNPCQIVVDITPTQDCRDAHLAIVTGKAAGASLPIQQVQENTVNLIATADPVAVGGLAPGDKVRIDNGWTLALQTYHRHQVPPEPGLYGWDQFRNADGSCKYPQRPVLVGPVGTANSAGAVISGEIHGKVLALAALTDIDSFPWQADWYRSAVKDAMGPRFDDLFALWFVDNAHHENPMTALQRTHVISYGGALQQALRDLAKWVEQGIRPAAMRYSVENAQVCVADDAETRGGIQPVITLAANGVTCARVGVGEQVRLSAEVTVPHGAGKVVWAAWDFDGSGEFADHAEIATPAEQVKLSATHAYDRPGTYFAVLRVASQREGNQATPYGRVENLARVRVVVE